MCGLPHLDFADLEKGAGWPLQAWENWTLIKTYGPWFKKLDLDQKNLGLDFAELDKGGG